MKLTRTIKIFLYMFSSSILSFTLGCVSLGGETISPKLTPTSTDSVLEMTTQTPSPLPTLTPKPTKTPTIEPSSTPSPELSPTLAEISGPLPDIVVSYSTHFFFECSNEDTNQIWFSEYPYSKIDLLLANSKIDYNFPQWSPDGEWIAYVESRPSTEESASGAEGTDSIWIMRSDGSEKRRVSDYVSRINVLWSDGCQPVIFIETPPIWSPNGKFILFQHTNLNDLDAPRSYYLTDVKTGKTQLLINQKSGGRPVWTSDSKQVIIVGDENQIIVVDVFSIDKLNLVSIMPPLDTSPTARLRIPKNYYQSPLTEDSLLIGTFYDNVANIPSLWILNLKTNEWSKLTDLHEGAITNPVFGYHWAISCNDETIFILDNTTWEILGTFQTSEVISVDCKSFSVSQDDLGNDLASYISHTDEEGDKIIDRYGIWVMQLQARDPEPQLFTLPVPTASGEFSYSIAYYSWRP